MLQCTVHKAVEEDESEFIIEYLRCWLVAHSLNTYAEVYHIEIPLESEI